MFLNPCCMKKYITMDEITLLKSKLNESLELFSPNVTIQEAGKVLSITECIVTITGLDSAQFNEVLLFSNGSHGIVVDIQPDSLNALLLDNYSSIKRGSLVLRTERLISIPVSDKLLGRIVDPLGHLLDSLPAIKPNNFYPLEKSAVPLFERDFVQQQIYSGVKIVDTMFPIGKGQRVLILGDPSTGKSALATDMVLHQKNKKVICIYVVIGQRRQTLLDLYLTLKDRDALQHSIIVAATSDTTEGLQYLAPYAGSAIAEFFLDSGHDVLIIYDDLSKHAFAYQTISLLLKRPPGREAFPGDIFYIHSRLLERACNVKNGGSITAIPIVETQGGRLSSYIPTNIISITDGQLYLDADLFNKNQRPAIDVGKSVSRIGGKTQIQALKSVAESLKLDYSQFLEVEIFTKLGVNVIGETAKKIRRGHRLRELLKQPRFVHCEIEAQIIQFFLLNQGLLDQIPTTLVLEFLSEYYDYLQEQHPTLITDIYENKYLSNQLQETLIRTALEKTGKYCHDN